MHHLIPRQAFPQLAVDPAVHGVVHDKAAMASVGGHGHGQAVRVGDAVKIAMGNHGIILAQDDPGGCGQGAKHIAHQGIAVQVSCKVREIRVLLDQLLGHVPQAFTGHDFLEVVPVGKQGLFDGKGLFPFADKIAAVDKPAAVQGFEGCGGMKHRADGHDFIRVGTVYAGPCAHTQGKITAQGKPHEKSSPAHGKILLDAAHRRHHFIEKAGVENTGIQVMAVAVVP